MNRFAAPPARRTRRLARETVGTLHQIVYQDDTTAGSNLALFERFDRWTAPLFAEFLGITPETARKRLRDLVDLDVVARVAGTVFGHGGREPDLYALAPHGAVVLDYIHGRPRNTTRAPQLAAREPATTANGRQILPHVAGGVTPHILNCLRLALHQGWVGDDGWWIMERLDSRAGDPVGVPIPDFARFRERQLLAVEVEGTLHRAHINEKHRRYAALADYLCAAHGRAFSIFLAIVFTFSDDRDYENARRSHELAFARQGRDYHCSVARLADVLAAPPATWLWNLGEALDREAIRRRESAHHDRLRRLYDDW